MGNSGLRALVTGGPGRGTAVIAALERRGFSVDAGHCVGKWGPVQLPRGPFQCYVQLPWVADALVLRLDLLAAVASRLGPRASVLLALDEAETRNAGASADLLEALARVILEESGRPEVRVSTLPAAEFVALPDTSRAPMPASAG